MKKPAIYIVTNKRNGTLYTGVTSHLVKRLYEHKQGLIPGFTAQYNCKMLVWYSLFETMADAIESEKTLKKSSRLRKIKLIEKNNPTWDDLYEIICQ